MPEKPIYVLGLGGFAAALAAAKAAFIDHRAAIDAMSDSEYRAFCEEQAARMG